MVIASRPCAGDAWSAAGILASSREVREVTGGALMGRWLWEEAPRECRHRRCEPAANNQLRHEGKRGALAEPELKRCLPHAPSKPEDRVWHLGDMTSKRCKHELTRSAKRVHERLGRPPAVAVGGDGGG